MRRLIQTLSLGELGLDWRAASSRLEGAPPQSRVRGLLADKAAIRSFASFVNSRFNEVPAANSYEDGLFSTVVFVLQNDRPWRDVFLGRFTIDGTNGQVRDNPAAPPLGYFNRDWLFRYRGNEVDGVMLSAAYRTMQNTVGLKLVPAANNGEGDATATGRERVECRGCHYSSPYALDRVASLLPVRRGKGAGATIEVVPVTPQTLFGKTIDSHEALVLTLVESEAFLFHSCRLAFQYVYGRRESACEGELFDRCIDAFKVSGKMQDGLAALLEAPQFCDATEVRP